MIGCAVHVFKFSSFSRARTACQKTAFFDIWSERGCEEQRRVSTKIDVDAQEVGWIDLTENVRALPSSTDRFAFARSDKRSYLPSILYGANYASFAETGASCRLVSTYDSHTIHKPSF